MVYCKVYTDNYSSFNSGPYLILFEALLFMHANRILWDERTVQKAFLAVRDNSKQEQLEKKLKEAADHDALMTADHEALEEDEHETLDSEY